MYLPTKNYFKKILKTKSNVKRKRGYSVFFYFKTLLYENELIMFYCL